MLAALEAEGLLPRPPITLKTVDRESVRSIVQAERILCRRASELGIDVELAHRGYAPYIEGLMSQIEEADRSAFQSLLVEETLNNEELDNARARLAVAEADYQRVVEETKPPSRLRVFMAGVNITVLAAVALYFLLR